jgi:small subunit ribosomal protein S13
MIYLLESKLPVEKSISRALQHVYGIGHFRADFICKKLGFSHNFKANLLSERQITRILTLINTLKLLLAHDLKKFRLSVVKRLISIRSYRGLRRRQGLPIRGQRTHTNAKSSKKVR